MRNSLSLVLSIFLFSCNQAEHHKINKADSTDATVTTPVAAINETREKVSEQPVATFSKKVPDELNDWKFAVNVYETKNTFRFLMKMQYMELTAEDTLKIPDFGIEPAIVIKPGKEPFSCIVGFLDKDQQFKEYKLVTAKDDNLSVKILHRYATVTYEAK